MTAGVHVKPGATPLALLMLISLAAMAAPVADPGPGQAAGTMTVDGRVTRLAHAFARVSKNHPGDEQEFTSVLLSDVPVAPIRATPDGLRKMARDGRLHAIAFLLGPQGGVIGVTLYDPAIPDGSVPAGFDREFQARTADAGSVAGRLVSTGEGDWFGVRFSFDTTFQAVVAPYLLALSAADRSAIAALPPGTAAGELTVGAHGTMLAHAYAVGRTTFPGDPEKVSVLLSDTPIPESVLLSDFGLQELAGEGQIHAVEVEIGADGKAGSGRLHHRGFAGTEPGGGAASISVSGMHRFVPEVVDANTVSGKLLMQEMESFLGTEFHYSATFRAAVVRRPPPTHEGAAAAASGPGKAVAAFLRAARSGDKAALRKQVAPAMASQLDGPDGAAMLKMMKASFPAGLKVVEVTESGDTAEVVAMTSGRDGRESLKLHATRTGGAWRVGQPGGPEEPARPRDPPTPEQVAAAQSGPGKALLAFVDALHRRDLARMKALSTDPDSYAELGSPLGRMALEILAQAFPWDVRVTRVTQDGDTAVVEADSAMAKEPLKVEVVRVRGAWKIAVPSR